MSNRSDPKDPLLNGAPLPGMLDLQLILDLIVTDGKCFLLSGERPYIKFGSDKKLSGFSGCNTYFGTYGVNENRIAIGKIGSTRMYCEGMMEIETKYLSTLEKIEKYEIESIRLRLFSEDNRNVLRFYVPV
jgi:heat shock protein HslJ